MTSLPPFWEPVGFQDRLAAWIRDEQPPVDVINIVIGWIERQLQQPYLGVRRETDILPNLWSARVPGTDRDGSDVFVSYVIFEEIRRVRCDQISTLSR